MNRREARENTFLLLFEASFQKEKTADEVYEAARLARGLEEDAYVRTAFWGAYAHREELDAKIGAYSHGWKITRLSPVARTIMELAVYEMLYMPDVPVRVSLNEALELVKRYDEEGARAFVNGVLNAIAGATKDAEQDDHDEHDEQA